MSDFNKMLLALLLLCLLGATPYAEALFRDPTHPPEQYMTVLPPAQFTGGLALQSIVRASSRQLATINGQVLRVGQFIHGFKVLSIEKDSVKLEGVNGMIELHLYRDIGKRERKQPRN